MAQIFHRSFNVVSKASIFGAVFILAGAGWAASVLVRSSYLTNLGNARTQPIQFSHAHHVNGLGIDCRYCHTSVEDSAFAGIPPTKTCMNCHSQIWVGSPVLESVRESYRTGSSIAWERVHRLAGFAYFDHSIHVKKGVGCVSCHGRVDLMPAVYQNHTLLMEWCLDCHRSPEKHLQPRETVFDLNFERRPGNELVQRYNIQAPTQCSACHR